MLTSNVVRINFFYLITVILGRYTRYRAIRLLSVDSFRGTSCSIFSFTSCAEIVVCLSVGLRLYRIEHNYIGKLSGDKLSAFASGKLSERLSGIRNALQVR